MYSTIFFDCDSTLIDIESLDVLGERMGCGDEVRRLTELAMSGSLPMEDVFKRKMDLMRPTRSDVLSIAELCRTRLVLGAIEVVRVLQEAGKRVFLVSSNFQVIVDVVAEVLGIPFENVIANDIYFTADGSYAGISESSPLCRTTGKAEIVRTHLRVGEKSVFVGDGMTDASTVGIVDLFIGYGGVVVRDAVREKSDVYVADAHFGALLPFILG